MKATVDEVISEILSKEGGFVHHPDDRGGATKYGITQKTLSEHRRYPVTVEEVRDLMEEEARQIYRDRYFLAPGFARVAVVSMAVAAELTDTGVNMGPEIAGRFLQRALNALNLKGKTYADLVVDGQVGPATVEALRLFLQLRGPRGERVMLKALNSLQAARYIELAERREANESFVFGWIDERVNL